MKVILRLVYSGITETTIGKRRISWPIAVLLFFFALVYFDM